MIPKPAHLGPDYAEQFSDPAVVAAYGYRPPYPDALWPELAALVRPPHPVLDVGTGTGAIARALARRGLAVQAVDPSAAMLVAARSLPSGDLPALTWVQGQAETCPLTPPYGLITAGASLHWMDWAVALPRFRAALAPGAVLAIVEQVQPAPPWAGELQPVINRYSTNRDFQPYDLVDELVRRGLFRVQGRQVTDAVTFAQPVAAYVESFHARNGFSRERMTPAAAAAFDGAVRELVAPHTVDGMVRLRIAGSIIWGEPAPPAVSGPEPGQSAP